MFFSTGILYFVSATVNPILYNVMSVRYRKAFHNTLHRACRRNPKPTHLSSTTSQMTSHVRRAVTRPTDCRRQPNNGPDAAPSTPTSSRGCRLHNWKSVQPLLCDEGINKNRYRVAETALNSHGGTHPPARQMYCVSTANSSKSTCSIEVLAMI